MRFSQKLMVGSLAMIAAGEALERAEAKERERKKAYDTEQSRKVSKPAK